MEKPILFNTDMVKAILEGRKTQTRRVVKPQPKESHTCKLGFILDSTDKLRKGNFAWGTNEHGGVMSIAKPPYAVGDTIWVRETWADIEGEYWYKADKLPLGCIEPKWRPSIHMPREAARIFLRVTNVRVERVQDITESDARAEGVNGIPRSTVLYPNDDYIYPFKQLWNSLNQKRSYGWDTNPWVWVIEFERMV